VIAGRPITVPDLTNPDDPAASRAELSAALGRELKPTFGVIPVADSARLETAQRYVMLFDAFVVVLFVVAALLALLTIAWPGIACASWLSSAWRPGASRRLIINAAADSCYGRGGGRPGAITRSNIQNHRVTTSSPDRPVALAGRGRVAATAGGWCTPHARREAPAVGERGRRLVLAGRCVHIAWQANSRRSHPRDWRSSRWPKSSGSW
jgi:hypothetical protein